MCLFLFIISVDKLILCDKISLVSFDKLKKDVGFMPLVIAPLNVELMILRILVDEKDKKHFESLGIAVNQKIMVLSNTNGSVILKVKEGRLALDKNIATKIVVTIA